MAKSSEGFRFVGTLAGLASVAVTVVACNESPNEHACTDIAFTGVTVVVPGGSALVRLGQSITGTLTDGAYSEPMQVSANPSGEGPAHLLGAVERAGKYTLQLRIPGYADVKTSNLVVNKTSDGCHVKPITITATLNPL